MNADQQRKQLYALLGDVPDRDHAVKARVVDQREQDGYALEVLELELNGIERVTAHFVKPLQTEGRLATVLYNHAHGGNYALGKDELLNSHPNVLLDEPYARTLTAAGFAVLAIDHWCFGQRNHASEHDTFKSFLWQGKVLWGMMVFDSLKAIDYLVSREDVDAERIGTFGMSMGSAMAQWVSALDTRIKACAELCCLVDFQALMDARLLSKHNFYYYVPGLLKHFSAAKINALIAPRPHLSCVGTDDMHAPMAGVERIDSELSGHYAEHGARDAWQLRRFDCGHEEIPAMRQAVIRFLQQHLT